ncbi:MAG TPA: DUF6249 domain-containing protein [Brevundimonas sp.]|jgi:hypothetical protein|uniref:DUF6249 domain-containing protein n=1 Tax=Brevundimonas sp. TaxID=1871086 RepID=UPI002E15F888|nr:DUF6249 domain-containing protein [Brevundimonas sp.]
MDELVPIFGMFAVFGSLVAIVIGPGLIKARERREVQVTVRAALDKGQPLPPEVIETLTRDIAQNLSSRTKDLRRGVLTLAAAAGIALLGYAIGMEAGEAVYPMLGLAAVPAMIGLAFIVLSFFNPNRD